MKFASVFTGAACAGLTLALIVACPQDGKPKAQGPAGAPAAGKPAQGVATQPAQGALGAGAKGALGAGAKGAQNAAAKGPQAAAASGAPAAPASGAPGAVADQESRGKGLLLRAGMPSEHHKRLGALVGTWNIKVKSVQDPGAAPVETTGTSVFAVIMDGRYVMENVVGETPAGPFNGMGLYGYNNMTNEFESTWVDNMSTGMLQNKGDWDDTQKAFKWHGEFVSPKNGGRTKSQSIMKRVDAGTFEFTMFEERGDVLFKSLEITYVKA
jgi:hypothetical protein